MGLGGRGRHDNALPEPLRKKQRSIWLDDVDWRILSELGRGKWITFCCGGGKYEWLTANENSNQANDVAYTNPAKLAVYEGGSAWARVGVFNWEDEARTVTTSVSGLPDGWFLLWLEESVEVGPGEVGYMHYQLSAPTSVSEWPTLEFTHGFEGHPEMDSGSVHEIVNAETEETVCAGWAGP